jgi:ribosomal protein L44E
MFDIQNHKNLSPSSGPSQSSRNGPTTAHQQQQQYQHLHHPHQALAVFGNKTKSNVGHKASQTKRIQLSTAAKRCKSINQSSAVDNNNSKSINLDDICKADDGLNENEDNDEVDGGDCEAQRHRVESETTANNSISTQSTESPTLVKVSTWYTESSVPLPSSQGVIF